MSSEVVKDRTHAIKGLLGVLIWVLVVLGVGVWCYNIGAMFGNRDQGLTVVNAVCDYSHNLQGVEGAGAWEDACGKAQDSINAEYICNKGLTQCQAELKR